MRRYIPYSIFIFALTLMIAATSARAEVGGDKSKFGFGLEGFGVSSKGYNGIALGFRDLNYFGYNTGWSWGYQLWAGSSTGITGISNTDHAYYGGLNLGNDGLITNGCNYELNVLLGYADTNFAARGVRGDSLLVEPSAGIGLLLGYGWRGTISIGYLYAPHANGVSGMTIGLRLDRKIFSSSHGADE